MRYLVLTDIHSNFEALDASLADAHRHGFDETLVLGDIVGYGADPNEVIEMVKRLEPTAIVRGNHDKVGSGLESPDGFNAVAKTAARWTLDVLTPEHRQWIAALPQGPVIVDDLIEICHGSPFDEDVYVFDTVDARRSIETSRRPVCLFGHTHLPVVFEQPAPGGAVIETRAPSPDGNTTLRLHDGAKYLVNPGSIGQPRDGNPRAAYAIVDTGRREVSLFRIGYRFEETQAKMIRAGLPEVLASRLALGR